VAVEQQRAHTGGGTDVLLERDVEMGLLADLVRDAAQGRGGLLLLTPLPGLGKSALLDHGVGVAQDAGLLVLRARGHQLEQAFGWGVGRSLFEGQLLGWKALEREFTHCCAPPSTAACHNASAPQDTARAGLEQTQTPGRPIQDIGRQNRRLP
jgi:hypothetical protein